MLMLDENIFNDRCIVVKSDDPNFFYLSGIDEGVYSGSFLLVKKFKNKIEKLILTSSLYEKQLKKFNIPVIVAKRNEINQILREKIKEKIGLNYNNISKHDFDFFTKFGKPVDISSALEEARSIKTNAEIKKIEIACKLTSKVMGEIPDLIKIGEKELSIAAEIDTLIREKNCVPAFETIVASGINSSFPHHIPGEKRIKRNEFVLVDFGCSYRKYCADMSRTFFVGSPSREQLDVYNTVLEAQIKAISMIKSGSRTNDIFNVSNKILEKYQPLIHSLGHGVGLSVHESPNISLNENTLKHGMITTIEPATYLDNFGVRIEDVFLIEKNKCKQLTNFEKELICV